MSTRILYVCPSKQTNSPNTQINSGLDASSSLICYHYNFNVVLFQLLKNGASCPRADQAWHSRPPPAGQIQCTCSYAHLPMNSMLQRTPVNMLQTECRTISEPCTATLNGHFQPLISCCWCGCSCSWCGCRI